MPCNIDDVNITEPDGPDAPLVPGFGPPFAPKLPEIPFPEGFPEDLLEIYNAIAMILPPGTLKSSMNINFTKDVFDAIMNLLDKFFPFLMLYKFFLPVLNLIICIIEVLCALVNPFKLIRKLKKLFRNCIPEFLSLFPVFALIVMILSLLFLLLELIEYIILQILKLIQMLLRNIRALLKAVAYADQGSINTIIKKIGMLLCGFQNLFVLLAIFAVIIQIIKDILKLLFKIPPCDDNESSDADNCCDSEVCPDFIRNNEDFTRTTATFQFYPYVGSGAGIVPGFVNTKRAQSYQLYDVAAPSDLYFINIVDAPDVTSSPKKVFYPTDVTYSAGTPPNQAAYKVDLRVFYDPVLWGRIEGVTGTGYGAARFVRFKDCIVIAVPSRDLVGYNNGTSSISSGVIKIGGGSGTEDNGAALLGFDSNGVTPNSSPATLENFLFTSGISGTDPPLNPTDGKTLTNVEYTFKINHEVLLSKALITLGCIPSVSLDRTFVNSVFGASAGINLTLLKNLLDNDGTNFVNGIDPNTGKLGIPRFPNVAQAQTELQAALDALRADMSEDGVNNFKNTTDAILNNLRDTTNLAINDLVGIGVDQYKCDFTLSPEVQFTSRKIIVTVILNEHNGLSLTDNLPESVASGLESRLSADLTFGILGPFKYDGSKYFTTTISSTTAGSGTIKVYFDNKAISTVTVPDDITLSPTVTEKELPYTFVFTPTTGIGDTNIGTGVGDSDGQPRRDTEDLSKGAPSGDNRGG